MVAAASGALPTDVPSLIQGYQDARNLVELPQGGMVNPMAIAYDPMKTYRLLQAVPQGGYNDSESVNGSLPRKSIIMLTHNRHIQHMVTSQAGSRLAGEGQVRLHKNIYHQPVFASEREERQGLLTLLIQASFCTISGVLSTAKFPNLLTDEPGQP